MNSTTQKTVFDISEATNTNFYVLSSSKFFGNGGASKKKSVNLKTWT